MQGKGLATLATLAAALTLAACGGGDGGETGTSAGAEANLQAPAAVEDVQERADQIEEERRQEEQAKPESEGDTGGEPASMPAPPDHQDSGGGAAQFQQKGGDNSIQEFGQEGGGSDFENAAAVLHAYLDSRAEGRWEDACSYLSAEVVAGLEQVAESYAQDKQLEGCPDLLQAFTAGGGRPALKAAAEADVGSLRVEGQRGFLLFHDAGGLDFAMPVVLEGDEWRLSAPEATPLP